MKLHLLLVTFFCLNSILGQTDSVQYRPINYIELKQTLKDDAWSEQYDVLIDRYIQGDSTLNIDQKRFVYYGSVFQEFFNPYYSGDAVDSLMTIMNQPDHKTIDWDKTRQLATAILMENPFDLTAIITLYTYYSHNNQEVQAKEYFNRLQTIFDAILSSGDGLNQDSAYYVTQVRHEYEVLNLFELTFAGKQSLTDQTKDFLTVEEDGIEGLYFDVTPRFLFITEQFDQ